jgi:hypothetical protein
MPDPFDRHSRAGRRDCAESQPSRSRQRTGAAAEHLHPEIVPQGKRPPAKKDPDLCKAAHWKGPHKPGPLQKRQPFWRRDTPCRWGTSWSGEEPRWECWHEETCSGCGKVLRTGISGRECPEWHPMTDAERAAVDAKIERHREFLAGRAGHRPVITGPQGYRRPKAGGT